MHTHSSVDSSNSMNALHSSRCCFCKSAWIAPKVCSYNFVSSVHSSQTFCSDLVRPKRVILIAHCLAERKRKGVHVIGYVKKLLLLKPQLGGLLAKQIPHNIGPDCKSLALSRLASASGSSFEDFSMCVRVKLPMLPTIQLDKLFETAVVDQVSSSLFSGRRFIFTTLLKQP